MKQKFEDIFDEEEQRDPHLAEYVAARRLLNTDLRQGLRIMEELSHRGSIMSILFVADAMRTGWEYEQDLPGAERWYQVAVDAGSMRGLWGLALTHRRMGKHDEAIRELELAISNNYPPAMNTLASINYIGSGVSTDKAKAYELWRRGAALGHFYSKRNLAWRYLRGELGFWSRIFSISMFFSLLFDVIFIISRNKYSYRMR